MPQVITKVLMGNISRRNVRTIRRSKRPIVPSANMQTQATRGWGHVEAPLDRAEIVRQALKSLADEPQGKE